jgi:hypothetical protein
MSETAVYNLEEISRMLGVPLSAIIMEVRAGNLDVNGSMDGQGYYVTEDQVYAFFVRKLLRAEYLGIAR